MKRVKSLLALVLVQLSFLALTVGADDIRLRLKDILIESWDGEEASLYPDTQEPINWNVEGSKHTAESYPRQTVAMNAWPMALYGPAPENSDELGVFGVRGSFNRLGYNSIEIIPGVGSGDDFEPKPIALPGKVRTVNFWVWSSNYDYYVALHFKDNKGVAYAFQPVRLDFLREPGSIKYYGWRNLILDMPAFLKQKASFEKDEEALSLTKIVISSQPSADVSNFYIYLDDLSIVTDTSQSFYDGYDLTGKARIKEIWGEEE